MKRPELPSFDIRMIHQTAMLSAVARAHALQIEQLAEAAETMAGADLTHVNVGWLARELIELTHQAAVIEAAARRLSEGRT